MKTIDQLNDWLDKPVYDQGVLLYEKLIGTGFVLSMLKSGADDYNRNTLTQALTAKRDELATQQQELTERYPEELTASLDVAGLLMDERTALKERLRMRLNEGVTDSVHHKDWAFRILEIRDELGAIYGRKEFFDQHGYLPDVASLDAEATPAQLMKRLLTVRTYVTRYKKIVNRLPIGDAAYETNLQLLKRYTSEQHELHQQLEAMMTPPHVSLQN